MKITKSQLRILIENYFLSEGGKDREYIENLNITEEDKRLYFEAESQGLKIQEIALIEKIRGTFDLFHIIQSVLEFKTDKFKQKVKLKSSRLNDPNLLRYLNLSSFGSIQELDNFIASINVDLSSHDRSVNVPLTTGGDLEIVGQVGPWTIILPKTMKGSVSCDPNVDSDTTWCTTKRIGQNLFYKYAGDDKTNKMLFYVMDYNRTPLKPIVKEAEGESRNNDSRLSIGFVNSQPDLTGKDGGLSVDAANIGLTTSSLMKAFGQYYDEVMRVLNSSVQKYNGISPAIVILKKCAQSVEVLLSVIKDYVEDEKESFIASVFEQKNISPDVVNVISNNKNENIRAIVAKNTSIDPVILEMLSNDSSRLVKGHVARNTSASPQTLEKLSNDPDIVIKSFVAGNTSTNPEILEKLSNDPSTRVKGAVARNTATGHQTLKNLLSLNDLDENIKMGIASNISTNHEILDILSNDPSTSIKAAVGQNPSTKPETLENLSNDQHIDVKSAVSENTATKPEILEKLSNDRNKIVKTLVAGNTSANHKTLEKLSKVSDIQIKRSVARNTSTSPQTLEKLSYDSNKYVRYDVANNSSTSSQILQILSNDTDTETSKSAIYTLQRKSLEERKRYSLKFLL